MNQLIFTLLWLVTLIFFLKSKKYFSNINLPLSGKAKIFFGLISLILIGGNLAVMGNAYYKAYFPEYDYEKVSKSTNFHIYQPKDIPGGRIQGSKFYKWDKEFAGQRGAIRAIYQMPMSKILEGEKSSPIIITQVMVPDNFDLNAYVEEIRKTPNDKEIKAGEVRVKGWSGKAFERVFLLGSTKMTQLDMLSKEGIFISISAMNEEPEQVELMAGSLY